MFLSPVARKPLYRALAKGGSLWYCPESQGRLVTLAMAKHFLGKDGAREIWVRSSLSKTSSDLPCAGCSNLMIKTQEPGWMGGHEVDICRRCYLIWIPGETHREIPLPADLITPAGDSTILQSVADSSAKVELLKEKYRFEKESIHGSGPTNLLEIIPAVFGLPVEMSDKKPSWIWATAIISIVALVLHFFVSFNFIDLQSWGYYPNQIFKNLGLNIFLSSLLHGGWIHLLGNLYFFCVFSDDVEEYLGLKKFLALFFLTNIMIAVCGHFFSSNGNVPHVGLSGFIMAILAFYALQFSETKVAYLLPSRHQLEGLRSGAIASLRVWQWHQFSIKFVVIAFVLKDLLYYFVFERVKASNVSYSSHLFGALAGILFWFINRFFAKQDQKIVRVYGER